MFDQVKALRKSGKRPVIRLTPAAIIPVEKRRRGRPRKFPEGTPLSVRYRGKRGRGRPTCMARGCYRMLRMHQEAACSDVCASRIINDALMRLKQCGVTKEQLLDLYGE